MANAGIAGTWTADGGWLLSRRDALDVAIARMSANETAPSAALSAKVSGALLRAYDSPGDTSPAFRDMAALVDEAEGLLGFDLAELADEVSELGSVVPASPELEALHDRLVLEVQRRTGDRAAGDLHTDRAVQLYMAGRYGPAIARAGQALPLLVGRESRATMIRALDVIGESYLQMALPWAARGAWLVASTLAGSDAMTSAGALPRLVRILDRLRGTELRLGRLAQSLQVNRIYAAAAAATAVDTPSLRDVTIEADVRYEAALTFALMRLPSTALSAVARLPDLLAREDLGVARSGLLAALGHEDAIVGGLVGDREETLEFIGWLANLPEGPLLDPRQFTSGGGAISSRVLGVNLTATHDGGSPATQIAESCLGALEALLATGASLGIFGLVPDVRIDVRRGHFTPRFLRVASVQPEVPSVEVAYAPFDSSALTADDQGTIQNQLRVVITRILSIAFDLGPLSETLPRLLGDERALDRSLNFALSFATAGDLMGSTYTGGLGALFDGSEQLYQALPRAAGAIVQPEPSSPVQAEGPVDLEVLPHDQMLVARRAIDVPVWDRARWRGIFVAAPQSDPPLLALGFLNEGAARQIWRSWLDATGDLDSLLSVTIITDVSAERPNDYRVVVAPNIKDQVLEGRVARLIYSTARVHEMNPDSDQNLRSFRAAYDRTGRSFLGIAAMPSGVVTPKDVRMIGQAPYTLIEIRSANDLVERDWLYRLALQPMGN